MIKLKGIKWRILKCYMFIALTIVVTIQIILCVVIKNYYYKNIESSLKKQGKISVNIFNKYSYNDNFKSDSDKFIYTFSDMSAAEVQIIDEKEEVIQDSIGIEQGKKLDYPDIKKALNGESHTWIGKTKYSNEKIMSVSLPLKNSYGVNGVVRIITSLEAADNSINKLYVILFFTGVVVICAFMILSILLSNTITEPVKELIKTARKMAKGQLTIKTNKKYDDEIGELADTLNYMSEEILKSDKLKNEFISQVSHELRTPLTSVKGWTVTLRTGDLEDKDELLWGLDIIENETDRLTDMVEELLDFSRIIDKRMKLNLSNIDLTEFLHNLFKQMEPRAKRLGIILELNISEDIDEKIEGDMNRLKQVFINILDNAFKFTNKEGMVTIQAISKGKNIEVVIKDSGIGIPPQHLSKVTEKFYKIDTKDGGNGIGLSVANELVQLHGGILEIESEYGDGTTVIVKLPRIKK